MKIDLAEFGWAVFKYNRKAFLLYGGNEKIHYGLLSEIKLKKTISILEEEYFLNNFEIIITDDLFSNIISNDIETKEKEIIIIYDINDKHAAQYIDIIDSMPEKYILILTSTTIKTVSKLVKYFIEKTHCGAIPCYECNAIQSLSILKRQIKNINAEALMICADNSTDGSWNDIIQIANCYDKILDQSDINNIVNNIYNADSILSILLSKKDNEKMVVKSLQNINDNTEYIQLLRMWQTQIIQTMFFSHYISNGFNAYEAEKKVKPAIFFKNSSLIKESANKISSKVLYTILIALTKIELLIKQNNFVNNIDIEIALIDIIRKTL